MSAGCSIIASNTEPVNEVLQDQHNGIKVDFFNVDDLVIKIGLLLDNSKIRNNIGVQARNTILNKYDLNSICLPQQIEWAEQLVT
jgi:glycosyltransferase involved in cell wall biosynthesis